MSVKPDKMCLICGKRIIKYTNYHRVRFCKSCGRNKSDQENNERTKQVRANKRACRERVLSGVLCVGSVDL